MAHLLRPTVLNTPAQRAREADRQQKFHNLQKRSLAMNSLGEKPLRLLLDVFFVLISGHLYCIIRPRLVIPCFAFLGTA